MVEPLRIALFPFALIVPLFLNSRTVPPEVRKALFVGAWITPLLIIMASSAPGVATAPVVSVLISTPELIVTLELSPLIDKSLQFVVIVTVVPVTSAHDGTWANA